MFLSDFIYFSDWDAAVVEEQLSKLCKQQANFENQLQRVLEVLERDITTESGSKYDVGEFNKYIKIPADILL